MRKAFFFIVAATFLMMIFQPSAYSQAKGKFKYVGVSQCKMCHNSPKKGAQFKKWSASKHSQAYATLATPAAKKIAKAKGIADPQKSDACLKCHVTGHGQPASMFGPKFKPEDGVGCESCHGPGSVYKKMKVMKDITAGKVDRKTVGLTKPDEKVCKKCHNPESPSYKEFKFAEFWAKINHLRPTK